MQKRLNEILERKTAIKTEVAEADEARMTELETELTTLEAEETELRKKMDLQSRIIINPVEGKNMNEERAKKFAETNKMTLGVEEVRTAVLTSGNIATPTVVSGINDINNGPSSIVDMVYVENCEGMGTHRVAYVLTEASADAQTEGSAATAGEPTFDYVDITPSSLAVSAQISKQVKKQSPLQYEAKVANLALKSLKKKVAEAVIVTKLKASSMCDEVVAETASNNGKVSEKTLRDMVMNYGGDEISGGQGVLFLNKTDLIALGDVRGTNEKKAVYEIIPDANPNTGIIKDGGLAVKYCICSGLTACSGTAKGASKKKTMFYGDPKNFELDLFSNYEVTVSSDFAFTSLMDTILGDVEVGGDVTVPKGFTVLTIPTT